MNLFYPVLALSIGFIVVNISIPAIIRVAKAKRLFDVPNERTASKKIVPTLGGVAIFVGLAMSTIIGTYKYSFDELKYLIAAIIIMFFVGLKDDILNISAKKKLCLQILAALILILLGNFRFTNLHGILGIYEINYAASLIFSCFTIIVLINAFNLIDGIDGLASGIAMLTSATFGVWFLLSGHTEYGIMCFGFIGSLAAFFLYNVFGQSNKIFMGDTGSLILGITMSAIVIKFNEFNINAGNSFAVASAPAISVGILIVPVIDTLRVFFIRISEGRSPFSPDMNHIHHKLLKLGYSHLKATSIIVTANVFFIGLSWILSFVFDINSLFVLLFILGLAIGYLPSYIIKNQEKEAKLFVVFDIQRNRIEKRNIKFKPEIFTFEKDSPATKIASFQKQTDKKSEKTSYKK